MRKRKFISLILIMVLCTLVMAGCDEENPEAKEGGKDDAYEEYIHAALDAVNNDPNAPVEDTSANEEPSKVIHVVDNDDSAFAPTSENLPEESGVIPDFQDMGNVPFVDEQSSSNGDAAAGTTPTPSPTPTGTPDTFDVGVCCIYIKCEDDAGYGSEVVSAINKARTDLGYPELVENDGLSTCANRRTREVSAYLSHTRPNKEPFYSLAPDYFKAEMLGIGKSKSEATFDAWMTDPESRDLIFTTQYGSIGAHCIKVNDFYCVVVAFGD